LGLVSNSPINENTEKMKLFKDACGEDNLGLYGHSLYERSIPYTITTDITVLFISILRAITRNVLPKQLADTFNYKKIYLDIVRSISKKDDKADYYLHLIKFYADKQGDEFSKWFNDEIYTPAMVPEYIDEKDNSDNPRKGKAYIEDYDEKGYGVLDASKYGVTDIEGACKLFAELTGL
jgi:hypothetical protein